MFTEYLPDPSKAQEHLKKLSEVLNEDLRIRGYMNHVVDPAVTCKKATQAVVSVRAGSSHFSALGKSSFCCLSCKDYMFLKFESMMVFQDGT